jgi:hypothetical protein
MKHFITDTKSFVHMSKTTTILLLAFYFVSLDMKNKLQKVSSLLPNTKNTIKKKIIIIKIIIIIIKKNNNKIKK